MTTSIATNQTILVVGGGIGGMTAALEAAECGKQAAA
ncbi:MAG TPA: FAD-binding protein [Gallionella sp.]